MLWLTTDILKCRSVKRVVVESSTGVLDYQGDPPFNFTQKLKRREKKRGEAEQGRGEQRGPEGLALLAEQSRARQRG
jgi:hypothetical protein